MVDYLICSQESLASEFSLQFRYTSKQPCNIKGEIGHLRDIFPFITPNSQYQPIQKVYGHLLKYITSTFEGRGV